MRKTKKRSKFNIGDKSERTLSGVTYMSKLEMNYRKHLNLLTKATELKNRVINIEEQVPFECIVNGKKICKYLLDFRVTYGNGVVELVDTKGMITPIYRIKKKLVEALFEIKITEVKKGEF